MIFDKLFGPATVVYLLSATVAALWWASDLNSRVSALEHTTVTAERIARLEGKVETLSGNTQELNGAIRDLMRELSQRHPGRNAR